MKRVLSLVLVLALTIGLVSAAAADPVKIKGTENRKITINPAGLNESPEEMIAQGISPTTGRNLGEINVREGALGVAVTGQYQPIMVQVCNSGNGLDTEGKNPYRYSAVNGACADVVYEALQKRGGGETRFSMIFSDVIPDYAGFVRSTRLTHPRIRQEWECAFVTSGYSPKDVPGEWQALGVPNPAGDRNEKDPGIAYVGDFPKVWHPYVFRISDKNWKQYKPPINEVFNLTGLLQNVIPKDHQAANHTFKFTDELPATGDSGNIVYVTFGNANETDSRLEYDPASNAYIRYATNKKLGDMPYTEILLVNPQTDKKHPNKLKIDGVEAGEMVTFNNVIIQSIKMKWKGMSRPDPTLVGTGNADYFMGGKHIAGVWNRDDMNSRTVFYGEDGNEIELQRGRTLIILMDYSDKKASVKYE